jgi:hypothetical protein
MQSNLCTKYKVEAKQQLLSTKPLLAQGEKLHTDSRRGEDRLHACGNKLVIEKI